MEKNTQRNVLTKYRNFTIYYKQYSQFTNYIT